MLSIAISFISGIMLALAFPSANLHWLAWFSLAPLMYYTYVSRWGRALFCGMAFGVGFFGALLYWTVVFGKLPWFALAVHQSLFIAGFVLVAKAIGDRLSLWDRFVLIPSLWVLFECIRSLGFLGFTWGDIGYSQYKVLPVIQIASVTGVWGLSFLIALMNGALANLLTARRTRIGFAVAHGQVLICALLITGTLVYGYSSLGQRAVGVRADHLRVAVVQGNVDQGIVIDAGYTDKTWRTYTRMTLDAAKDKPDIIVWPETVVPGYAARDWYVRDRLESLARNAGSILLVGGWDKDSRQNIYNSVFLISPRQGILGQYSKVHLVPFGEFVPARKYLPFLDAYHVTAHDTSPGSGFNAMRSGRAAVGTAICFESIFQDIPRRLTRSGADVLCVVTNDCWYDETAAAEQHMEFSVFRAVENRRWLMRAATTGISCVIDPYGRVVAQTGVKHPGFVRASIVSRRDTTPYTRHGDWVVYVSIAAVVTMTGSAVASRRGKISRTKERA